MVRSPCKYCGSERKTVLLPRHEATCPRNPEIFATLRELMHDYAEGDLAMPMNMYNECAREIRLPWLSSVVDAFGTWRAFVAECGLRLWQEAHPSGVHTGVDVTEMPGSIMGDDFAWHDPSVLRCVPVRIPVRAWHPAEKRYVDVGAQEAWMVR